MLHVNLEKIVKKRKLANAFLTMISSLLRIRKLIKIRDPQDLISIQEVRDNANLVLNARIFHWGYVHFVMSNQVPLIMTRK